MANNNNNNNNNNKRSDDDLSHPLFDEEQEQEQEQEKAKGKDRNGENYVMMRVLFSSASLLFVLVLLILMVALSFFHGNNVIGNNSHLIVSLSLDDDVSNGMIVADTTVDVDAVMDSLLFPSSFSSSVSSSRKEEIRHFVSATLGSNMVLQRDRPVPIWGFSSQPGTVITTTLRYHNHYDTDTDPDTDSVNKKNKNKNSDTDVELTTTASSDPTEQGIWRQLLPSHPASMDPMIIIIESTSNTHESATFTNVLFGDVYLCGGQSNMQFSIPATTNATEEAHLANNYPHIRLFTVGQKTASLNKTLEDLQSIEQSWTEATAHSVCHECGTNASAHPFTYFSAVCWLFGREVSEGLHNTVPIGLISNNWGGTELEAWQPGGRLYNSMTYPYLMGPMAITGFTWYQGEANTKNQASAEAYAIHFPAMIQSWFQGFNLTTTGGYFGFVQLSTWCAGNIEAIPEMRQAQLSALTLTNDRHHYQIGYATNADHGAGCNIHPPSKQYCGQRLGRSALALHYGQQDNIHWKSPSYWTASVSSSTRSNTVAVTTTAQQQQDTSWSETVAETAVEVIVSVTITFQDVSSSKKGLYILDEPFNTVGGTFDCSQQSPRICAYPSILLNDGKGWRNATMELSSSSSSNDTLEPKNNQVIFQTSIHIQSWNDDSHKDHSVVDESNNSIVSNSTTVSSSSRRNNYESVSVLATSYGWGGVPMMTLYDAGTDLPVLPWKEKV